MDQSEKAKVAELIQKLGDGNYRAREQASSDLISMGAKVLADLRVAAKDPDGERARRADDCINKINASDAKRVPVGTARLTALRRPDGATEAMLGYLPFADDDDGMISEVKSALTTLALDPNGKPDTALVAALSDPMPIRRGVRQRPWPREAVWCSPDSQATSDRQGPASPPDGRGGSDCCR